MSAFSFRANGDLVYRLEVSGAGRGGDTLDAWRARRTLSEVLRDPVAAQELRSFLIDHGLEAGRLRNDALARWVADAIERGELTLYESPSTYRRLLTGTREAEPDTSDPFADAPAETAAAPPIGETGAAPGAAAAAAAEPEAPPAAAPAEAEAEVETEEPKLVSIEWLEGDDATVATSGVDQWVNLPKDAKWVDGTIVKNLDRLGQKPRLLVKFDKPGASAFKLRLIPGPGNVSYTGGEKGRNAKFIQTDTDVALTTEGDGTKIVDGSLTITCAGRDVFQAEAEDNHGIKKRSQALTTRRLVYYQEVKMKDAGGAILASTAANLTSAKTELGNHGIRFEGLAAASMNHLENIDGDADKTSLKNNARAAYTGAAGTTAKEPYVLAVAYTDHLAVKDAAQAVHKAGVDVGPGKPKVVIPLASAGGSDRYLWKDIITGEGWFVSAKFLEDGGAAADEVAIPEAKCSPVSHSAGYPELCPKVEIDVTGLAAATGTLSIEVNLVNRMRGGIALSGNIVIICTRAWWRNQSTLYQNQVVTHEVGHQLGLVADGSGSLPDKPANQYTARGHLGSHCHTGLALKATFGNADKGDCVMYGATEKSPFCAECAPTAKKVDLSAGWTRF
ncbi:MAG: hypothetical protein H6719_09920 [Sandaracinaceae bacterium]|nr:hypothetical protein [Sandaracinaceae bacterium]